MNRGLLGWLLALGGRLGAQPQRHVRGLHGLPYPIYQFVIERLQVCFVPELGGEGFQGLPSITQSFLATATTARLLAFLPPREAIFSP